MSSDVSFERRFRYQEMAIARLLCEARLLRDQNADLLAQLEAALRPPVAAGAADQRVETLPAGPGAPATARAALTRWLTGHVPGEVLEDARLLASELITNSAVAVEPLELAVQLRDGALRVELRDPPSPRRGAGPRAGRRLRPPPRGRARDPLGRRSHRAGRTCGSRSTRRGRPTRCPRTGAGEGEREEEAREAGAWGGGERGGGEGTGRAEYERVAEQAVEEAVRYAPVESSLLSHHPSVGPLLNERAQRAKVLEAMVQVVAEKGYAAATVADAVRLARVSRGTFYALFESKEACLASAYRLGCEVLEERIAEAVREAADWREELRLGHARLPARRSRRTRSSPACTCSSGRRSRPSARRR